MLINTVPPSRLLDGTEFMASYKMYASVGENWASSCCSELLVIVS